MFLMGGKGGWFLAGKSTQAGQPNAFTFPFLDGFKITENTSSILNNPLERCTTVEWEHFIIEAQEEWEEVQAYMLENIQEDPKDVDFDDDDDTVYFKEDFALSNPPEKFRWNHELPEPTAAGTLKSKLDVGDQKNAKETIESLQAAFGNLEGMVLDMCVDARSDALEVLTHVGLSVSEIVAGIDQINRRGRRWMSKIGDAEVLRNDSGIHNFTIVKAVTMVDSIQGPPVAPVEDPLAGLEELQGVISAIDRNFDKTCKQLNTKIKALEQHQSSVAGSTTVPTA